MFFTADDDEQDFLSAGGGSKLASVFGLDKASSQGGNESLTYTAPKQPKKKDVGGDSAAATAVAFATVVQAYKFVDNQYASQGKVGAAVLVNHAAHEYRILLYYNKQQQLTNAKLSQAFSFNVQANNYANFYDDARTNWSVLFNNAQDAEKFAKEVGLARALSAGGHLDGTVQQDLQLGEGGGLETGDSVEARYTGWLLTNSTFGQVFDSNASSDKLFRFKVGKGKVIKGWDTGMLGMRKGGKRLLVIPPSLAYGARGVADRVPANATLIFEVEVVRVKLQKGDATPEPLSQPAAAVTAPVVVPGDVPAVDHDDSVKERSRSITEQLSHSPKSDKAKLISRMAKMGQPMLPHMAGVIPAQPDSEEEPPSPQPTTAKPQLATKPHLTYPSQPTQPHHAQLLLQQQMHMAGQPMVSQAMAQPYGQQMDQMMNPAAMGGIPTLQTQSIPVSQPAFLQNLPGSQQLSVYQPQPTLLQQQQAAILAMQQQQQMAGLSISQPSPLSDPMAPMVLSETRQQTTEIRLTVSKMSDKVDRILQKVEGLSSTETMHHQPLPAPTMETSILLHNISRIVQENERLKKDVFEKGEKIESQNEKIAELLQKNQKYVEKSNTLLEERNEGYKLTADQSQSRILVLEQEKVQMATELSNASSRLASLQLELAELKKMEGELRQRLQSTSSSSVEQREELDRLRLQRGEDEKKIADLMASLREEKTARKQLDSQMTALQEETADIRAANSTLERNVNERKRKSAEERRKMEEEAEEMKAGYELEIQTLREKLRKQRTSTDVETADKVAKIEEELTAEWQAKSDKMVAAAADKHARQLATVREELQESQDKVIRLEAKIQELRSSSGSTDAQLQELQQQVEDNAGFREKYENLRNQATTMKQKYEERISELQSETETMATKTRELQQQLVQSRQQFQQQQLQQSASGDGAADVATEVKKVMNSVYQSLRGDFDASETYTGSEVLSAVLRVIKETTLKLVAPQTSAIEEEDDDEENDEEEEDEDEEEDDEEEEEEEKEYAEVEEKMIAPEVSKPVQAAVPKEPEDSSSPGGPEKRKDESSTPSAAEPPHTTSSSSSTKPAVAEEKEDGEKPEEERAAAETVSVSREEPVKPASVPPQSQPEPQHAPTPSAEQHGESESDDEDSDLFQTPPMAAQKQEQPSSAEEQVSDAGKEPRLSPPPAGERQESKAKLPERTSSLASDDGHAQTESGSVLPTLASREPPPLSDEDEDDDSPLFGADDTVADTLGSHFEPREQEQAKGDSKDKKTPTANKLPSKSELVGEDDLKPMPPPPLFGDDDDDEDLDWLS